MMWWYGDEMNGWGYVLMTLSMVVFWGLLIFVAIGFVRGPSREGWRQHAPPSAEELLALRFARGEIDEQEYRERLATLRIVPGLSSKGAPTGSTLTR